MSAPTSLPTGDRTVINTEQQITFCGSPIHLRIQNALQDATIESVFVYLWIWNGAQNTALGNPNHTFFKEKISVSDTYINFQISDQIKAFLESPTNAPNTNQPNFAYNEATAPAITGQGVFWQIVTDITSAGVITRTNYLSYFATLGWRWNYEQNGIGNNGNTPYGSTGFLTNNNRWYDPRIHHYFNQTFNLTNLVAAATTANMITYASVTPTTEWQRCTRDSTLLVFINKLGLWDVFTPHGKFTANTKIDSEITSKSYRDPQNIDNSYVHSKLKSQLDVNQTYIVNTGSLSEDMVQIVEEIIYSPKVYLIKFKGDLQPTSTLGITIDSTFITIDSTIITIDSATIGVEYLGQFKTYQQIPVVVTDSDFGRKTRVNDKNAIDYNLRLDETNNKILDIR
jgi:hypothetical protein